MGARLRTVVLWQIALRVFYLVRLGVRVLLLFRAELNTFLVCGCRNYSRLSWTSLKWCLVFMLPVKFVLKQHLHVGGQCEKKSQHINHGVAVQKLQLPEGGKTWFLGIKRLEKYVSAAPNWVSDLAFTQLKRFDLVQSVKCVCWTLYFSCHKVPMLFYGQSL